MVAVVVAGCRVRAVELGETVSNCPLRVLLKTAVAEPMKARTTMNERMADAALAGATVSRHRANSVGTDPCRHRHSRAAEARRPMPELDLTILSCLSYPSPFHHLSWAAEPAEERAPELHRYAGTWNRAGCQGSGYTRAPWDTRALWCTSLSGTPHRLVDPVGCECSKRS